VPPELLCVPLDKLLELLEQLPLLPLTLVEVLGVCATDELLLQLYAFATWKFEFGIAIAVIAIIAPNVVIGRVLTYSDYMETVRLLNTGMCYRGYQRRVPTIIRCSDSNSVAS
jgi:hypothetical protein